MSEPVVQQQRPTVLAAAAHPDDIEFMMAGTLLRLRQDAGAEIHMFNLANGHCGTATHERDEIIALRRAEAQASARAGGAVWHRPLVDDLDIFYEKGLLARVAGVVREVQPTVMLVPSPQDYMEDHANACRLLVTAGFMRQARNYVSDPPTPPYDKPLVVYHALPHGLRDGLGRLIRAGQYVDVGPVFGQKRRMLEQHRTQRDWLAMTQGMGAYVNEMERLTRQVGLMSGRFELAEGWRRHSHLGFAGPEDDPLADLLGDACWVDPEYQQSLG